MSAVSAAEKEVLLALGAGWTLKAHRYLDGQKTYRLHPLDEEAPRPVGRETMDRLREQGLIESNKKFPAATYLLTERGRSLLSTLSTGAEQESPLTSRGWQEKE